MQLLQGSLSDADYFACVSIGFKCRSGFLISAYHALTESYDLRGYRPQGLIKSLFLLVSALGLEPRTP